MTKKGQIIDRIGEENYNNFGSKMIIIRSNGARDIDVYFPEFNWIYEHTRYNNFKSGKIKCPYERRYLGKGYQGEGKYKISEKGKQTKHFTRWINMLERCYSEKYHEKFPTYKNCEVNEYFLNFQNFCEWYDENYYEVSCEKMCLDKDVLFKGNKIYSPETCVFVPERINLLLNKNQNVRGKNIIGIKKRQLGNYQVRSRDMNGKRIYLGTYSTQEEAFAIYKSYKEQVIKDVIDSYEGLIPEPHYSKLREAMYNYQVEIDD